MKFSLRHILPIAFSANILVVVATILLLLRWQGEKVVQTIAQEWQQEMGQHIETHLKNYLSQAEFLNQSVQSLLKTEKISVKDLSAIELFLRQQLKSHSVLTYTAWANTDGDYIATAKNAQQELQVELSGKATDWQYRTYAINPNNNQRKLIKTFPVYDPRTRPWYQSAIEAKKATWTPVYIWFDQSQLALDTVLPIYDKKGKFLGVADTPLPLNNISQFLSKLSLNRSSQSFIIDRQGQLIASSKLESLFKPNQGSLKRIEAQDSESSIIRNANRYLQKSLSSQLNQDKIDSFTFYENHQRQFAQVFSFKYGQNIDWLICLIVPESSFLFPLQAANRFALIVTLIALVIAILLSWAIARWITNPILDIYHASLEIASGNLQKKVAIASSYELAKMGQAFNKMAEDLKSAFDHLEFQAQHDNLTYLHNRLFLNQHLTELMEQQKTDATINYAVIFLDLDDFKIVNDSLGHLVGDELLKQVAHRLRTSVHPNNLLARFGGDEFVIVLSPVLDQQSVSQYAQRILRNFNYPFFLEHNQVSISISLGITFSLMGYEHPQEVLRDASIALFKAKREGKNRFQIMTHDLQLFATKRLEIITELKQALKEQQFCLYFQPIITLKDKKLAGFETLVRWQHPLRGLVSPGEFIAIAEEAGLIQEIDLFLLEKARQQIQQWQSEFWIINPMMLSLNFSPFAVKQPDILERITKILQNSTVEPWQLKLEVTESLFMDNFDLHRNLLEELQALGLEFCLDDFGTGHSSLSRLQELPIHTLKIDRSFVQQMESLTTGTAIVKTIINLAHALGMNVVAEGIETAQQEIILQQLGCDYAQGYFISRPLPTDQATNFLARYFPKVKQKNRGSV